jgi:hypothetical protein
MAGTGRGANSDEGIKMANRRNDDTVLAANGGDITAQELATLVEPHLNPSNTTSGGVAYAFARYIGNKTSAQLNAYTAVDNREIVQVNGVAGNYMLLVKKNSQGERVENYTGGQLFFFQTQQYVKPNYVIELPGRNFDAYVIATSNTHTAYIEGDDYPFQAWFGVNGAAAIGQGNTIRLAYDNIAQMLADYQNHDKGARLYVSDTTADSRTDAPADNPNGPRHYGTNVDTPTGVLTEYDLLNVAESTTPGASVENYQLNEAFNAGTQDIFRIVQGSLYKLLARGSFFRTTNFANELATFQWRLEINGVTSDDRTKLNAIPANPEYTDTQLSPTTATPSLTGSFAIALNNVLGTDYTATLTAANTLTIATGSVQSGNAIIRVKYTAAQIAAFTFTGATEIESVSQRLIPEVEFYLSVVKQADGVKFNFFEK